MARKKAIKRSDSEDWRLFQVEAEYADSIFRCSMGDLEGSIACLERACKLMPTYAPALLSMGSVEYQRGRKARGKKLFMALLTLPAGTRDLHEIIDKAATFLIQFHATADGLELYRKAIARFPDVAVFYQGLGCCAGHEKLHEEALQASRRALELEPDNQQFMNDLGWTLLEAGNLIEARSTLERAVAMDPSDELARENLKHCNLLIEGDGQVPDTQ